MDKQAEPEKKADPKEKIAIFCTMCLASDTDASWGGEAMDGHCFNCGAGGCTVQIPRWAVENIRKNASWVGKRYYAHEEDHEAAKEMRALRGLATEYPGRSTEKSVDGQAWWVMQKMGDGRTVSVLIGIDKAPTAAEAMEKMKLSLPYVPKGGYPK